MSIEGCGVVDPTRRVFGRRRSLLEVFRRNRQSGTVSTFRFGWFRSEGRSRLSIMLGVVFDNLRYDDSLSTLEGDSDRSEWKKSLPISESRQ